MTTEDNVLLEDSETLLEIRAAILLAAAAGVMEYLMAFEPAKHTKRYRKLNDMSARINQLFDLYPLVWEYDIVNLGCEFFNKEHEERLSNLLNQGIKILPPEAPDKLKKLVFEERWKRGDVLNLHGTTIIIHSVYPDEYHYICGPALLYSKANYPMNPFLHKWKRIDQLGEDATDEELTSSIYCSYNVAVR